MKLTVGERLLLLQILPPEGNIATLKVARKLSDTLALSEEEHKEFNIKQEKDKISWDKNGNEEREIEIGEKATDIIVDSLKNLDKMKTLTPHMMILWEKFIESKKDEED